MIGKVSVYKGYESEPIYEESNMILDGFKEHVANMMTMLPYPSGIASSVSSCYHVSNFTIQGVSFSPAKSAFRRLNSLAPTYKFHLSSSTLNSSSVIVLSSINPSGTNSWTLGKQLPNQSLNTVNSTIAGYGGVRNSLLKNTHFLSSTTCLYNSKFKYYSVNTALSSAYINEYLYLYELGGWDLHNPLKYSPSSTEYNDSYIVGSCARYDASSVSSLYSYASALQSYSPYKLEAVDGILYIRSFGTSADILNKKGVRLSQDFTLFKPEMRGLVENASAPALAELTLQYSSVSGAAGASIQISVKDTVTGEFYNFSGSSRNSWNSSGSNLVLPADAGASGILSKFINVPNDRVKNKFKVTYNFYCTTSTSPLACYAYNFGVNIIDGWNFGNVYTHSDISRINAAKYAPDLFSVTGAAGNLAINFIGSSIAGGTLLTKPLSSLSYISQGVKLSPLKKYCAIIRPENAALTANTDSIEYALVKWKSSDVESIGKFNLLNQITCSALHETRLGPNYCIHPDHPRTKAVDDYEIQLTNIKPSDICLEVSSGQTISGVFYIGKFQPASFNMDILPSKNDGTVNGNLQISIYTSALTASGTNLSFIVSSGAWSTSSSDTIQNTSSLSGTEYVNLRSAQLLATSISDLVPVDASGFIPLILKITNNDTKSAFIKNVRVDAYLAEMDTVECYRFYDVSASNLNQKWTAVGTNNTSRNGAILSGSLSSHVYDNFASATGNNIPYRSTVDLIYGMNAASGSVHDSGAMYEVIISTSEFTTSKTITLAQAQITDASLSVASNNIYTNEFTSEGYLPVPKFGIVNEPIFYWNDTSTVYGNTNTTVPGAGEWSEITNYQSFDNGINIGTDNSALGNQYSPIVKFAYTIDYSSLDLPYQSDKIGFSFDFNFRRLILGTPYVKWQAVASIDDETVVWWDASSTIWKEFRLGQEPVNEFLFNGSGLTLWRGAGFTSVGQFSSGPTDLKTIVSPAINLTRFEQDAPTSFNNSSKITIFITAYDFSAAGQFFMRNFQLYNIVPALIQDLPQFPSPEDEFLQSPEDIAAEYGQFTNQIETFSQWDELSSIDQAPGVYGRINWPPLSAGIAVLPISISGVNLSSSANTYGVLSPEGYLLRNGGALANVTFSGFHVSAGTSSIKYIIDVNYPDLFYLNQQGGVAVMGLNVVDLTPTLEKFIENGVSTSSLYTAGTAPKLYNITRTNSPIFKLVAKKVFRKAITSAANTYPSFIRIVWELKFI